MLTAQPPLPRLRASQSEASPFDALDLPRHIPRRRILVGAYAVSPARGSEPGMGWNICRELAAWHDVTVLCAPGTPGADHSIHRREIEAYQKEHGPVPGLTFHFVSPPALSRLCQRESGLMRRTLYYTGYAAWQRAAYRAALELHRARPFELAHQLNITGYREPGYLWKLPVPFVWGPVGGAADIPPAFFGLMSGSDRCYYRLRNWGNAVQKRFAWRCRQAAAKASKVWAIGAETRRMARDRWGVDAADLLESGTNSLSGVRPKVREAGQPLRLVWSGVHIGRKALPILLHELAEMRRDPEHVVCADARVPLAASQIGGADWPTTRDGASPVCDASSPIFDGSSPDCDASSLIFDPSSPVCDANSPICDGSSPVCDAASGGVVLKTHTPSGQARVHVTILGDGPETMRWRHLADTLGVSPYLTWTGKLPRRDALLEVERADAMAFTSLQEGTPHAVLEALSLGLPVICHDACGMGAAVTDECGIKIDMHSPQASIAGFASALRRLCDSPGELTRLSAGALRRATELGWAAKGQRIALAYDQVLSSVPAVRP
jgi:hypothetical protein